MLKKLIYIPISLLLILLSCICFCMIYLSYHYVLPAKADVNLKTASKSYFTRAEYVQPTEPPTEPPTMEEPEPEPEPEPEAPYYMQLDMSTVSSYHNSNSEVVGWIKISGTVINYPIMQNGDNEYYVNHSWNKQSSHAGAIFADFRCNLEKSDDTILYGHNMGNGSMFHAIKNYKTSSWGNSHKYIEIATLEHRYLYKILSCNVLYGEAGAKFEYWNFVEMNRTDYRNFLNGIRNSATVWYGDDKHLPRDNYEKIITLQTCNSGANDGIRCVVFAYRVGEF
ncbi:MAG: class B sortase [Ruminococcus sp.]|nr:class B sortase [Ruminococcus sp.]